MHAASDEDLARRAQQGCAASLDHLLRRYQVPVLHFLRHRGAGSEAEDLLQETLLRVFRHLDQYNPRWSFRTWMFTIARRVSINGQRGRSRWTAGEEPLAQAVSAAPDPAEAVAESDGQQRLWEAAARVLSEEDRTALWLYYVESLSLSEVARVLQKSWLATKVQLFRARRKLAPELRRLGHAPSFDPGLAERQAVVK
jgi:RNA polymerase sigma-70 factor (ECF subfamily)